MSKKHNKPTAAATTPAATATAEPTPTAPELARPTSVVDQVFDAVTAWAAQGLTAAKKGLEVSARWLDGRAKVVGELATKLAPHPAAPQTSEPHSSR